MFQAITIRIHWPFLRTCPFILSTPASHLSSENCNHGGTHLILLFLLLCSFMFIVCLFYGLCYGQLRDHKLDWDPTRLDGSPKTGLKKKWGFAVLSGEIGKRCWRNEDREKWCSVGHPRDNQKLASLFVFTCLPTEMSLRLLVEFSILPVTDLKIQVFPSE